MPIFPSHDQFRAILAPITKDAVTQLGSRVTVKRSSLVFRSDNSPARTWGVVASNVGVLISGVTAERLQTVWGVDSPVTAEGSAADDSFAFADDDVIVVTSGDFTGQKFQVVRVMPNPIAGALALGLTQANLPGGV